MNYLRLPEPFSSSLLLFFQWIISTVAILLFTSVCFVLFPPLVFPDPQYFSLSSRLGKPTVSHKDAFVLIRLSAAPYGLHKWQNPQCWINTISTLNSFSRPSLTSSQIYKIQHSVYAALQTEIRRILFLKRRWCHSSNHHRLCLLTGRRETLLTSFILCWHFSAVLQVLAFIN